MAAAQRALADEAANPFSPIGTHALPARYQSDVEHDRQSHSTAARRSISPDRESRRSYADEAEVEKYRLDRAAFHAARRREANPAGPPPPPTPSLRYPSTHDDSGRRSHAQGMLVLLSSTIVMTVDGVPAWLAASYLRYRACRCDLTLLPTIPYDAPSVNSFDSVALLTPPIPTPCSDPVDIPPADYYVVAPSPARIAARYGAVVPHDGAPARYASAHIVETAKFIVEIPFLMICVCNNT